jgi:2-methylisocitrate lyase-like PEP mutase family enzyme
MVTERVLALRAVVAGARVGRVADVHDGLSVRLAERAGFDALLLTGSAANATLAGQPDGTVPPSDVLDLGVRLAGLTSLPLLIDLDDMGASAEAASALVTGARFGAVAGVMVDDLAVGPDGPIVLDESAAIERVGHVVQQAAGSVVVVARTELARTAGPPEVHARLGAFERAGADLGFAAALPTIAQTAEHLTGWSGRLPLLAVVEDVVDPRLPTLGVSLAVTAPTAFLVGAAALRAAYAGGAAGCPEQRPPALGWGELDGILRGP